MTYAAEVMPVALRAYLLSNINMCWLLGQICGVGIVRALLNALDSSQWSYRMPFGLQWAFALPIMIGVLFAPESPCECHSGLLRLLPEANKRGQGG
jgi:SP family general alpha glucoside:H+ symporter-like MFS transporter